MPPWERALHNNSRGAWRHTLNITNNAQSSRLELLNCCLHLLVCRGLHCLHRTVVPTKGAPLLPAELVEGQQLHTQQTGLLAAKLYQRLGAQDSTHSRGEGGREGACMLGLRVCEGV